MFHFSDKRLLVSEMSIHRTDSKYVQPGQQHLKKIADRVNVPPYAPPEVVISAVMETKNDSKSFYSFCSLLQHLWY